MFFFFVGLNEWAKTRDLPHSKQNDETSINYMEALIVHGFLLFDVAVFSEVVLMKRYFEKSANRM